jgi:hypothetical protein
MGRHVDMICCYTDQHHTKYQEGPRTVEKIRVYHDRTGNPLTVCFDDPKKEYVCEEIDDDIVLMKDRRGRVLGFERLNYLPKKRQEQSVNIPVEVQVM